jgi:hypothetical protein
MKANLGNVDSIIRIVLGIGLSSLLVLAEGGLRYVGLIGVVLILTAVFRFCPIYALLGIHTSATSESKG